MKFTFAAVALAFVAFSAAPSAAQTSTCYRLGNVASCSFQPNADNPAQQRYSGFQEVERLHNQNEEREEARKQQGLREEVGALVADGKCADARKAALRAGDFALADQAGAMCKPAQR
ncbi:MULTISPECIES: hypothetical protein [Novosphingobium]|uniref:Uncharacterized protein n=1 Tax=Novosphingobium pentaromativorans TaxID=205844 RepID=A0A2W5QDR5_9SPHN|nr:MULTISPECIES: hypothetical protein [Novosphingobium]PZQ55717.1 MAG: hypothetical protein DI555_06735 [Novosphingobium pentaromativorans]GFE72642.1 hypothetical protein NTCA1_02910 [Novosphingobium sp. TCA1]